ncbi:MAG: NADH-quinone oxidoreductase subunit H [Candidatus Altiarchaeota archaeon]|nr:NADH-quinone oxidoreductase subunit H [Candidatus Altiarchaeota archaeon]
MLIESLLVLVVAYFIAFIIPGIERKIQARIQRRYGPPILTPGFWSILKFTYKKGVKPDSPSPWLYHLSLILAFASTSFLLLWTTPFWAGVMGFATYLGLAGLLKVEEVTYLFMGSLSQSVMSKSMAFPDTISGAKPEGIRSFFEEHAAVRALKMITLGSFPFYLALAVPFMSAYSLDVNSVLENTPVIYTISGVLGAIVYFFGYNIVSNNRPFDIIKPKVDVIEGPYMEYAGKWRALSYEMRGLLMFVLSSMFVSLYLGIPLAFDIPEVLATHLALAFVLPCLSAVLKAFSPVLTFKQIYPISSALTVLGFLALVLNYFGV